MKEAEIGVYRLSKSCEGWKRRKCYGKIPYLSPSSLY